MGNWEEINFFLVVLIYSLKQQSAFSAQQLVES